MDEGQTLIDAFDLSELPPHEQEELLADLATGTLKSLMLDLFEKMTPQARKEFETLIGTNPSEEQLVAFIQANVPDADKVVEETLRGLAGDILAVTKK